MGASPLRIAALIKQIPRFEEFTLGPDGRLLREGLGLEINPYCRRTVAKGVELARDTGGFCAVVTLGPPSAAEALREMVAAGADLGVHICDPAFAGSDTLVTARALAAGLKRLGSFDLVLVGLNSVDADTGQVGPELAELLGLPFASGVRTLDFDEGGLIAGCERDNGWVDVRLPLPAMLSVAERLCKPAVASRELCLAVPPERIQRVSATDLGPGPWGAAGSPTTVGRVRVIESSRLGHRLAGEPGAQVDLAVQILVERGALDCSETAPSSEDRGSEPRSDLAEGQPEAMVAVLVEPDRHRLAGELLGAAAELAPHARAEVVGLGVGGAEEAWLLDCGWADEVVRIDAAIEDEEATAATVATWASEQRPWALLGPSTSWGRHVMSRIAARLGAGLTGDAIGLEVDDGRLVALKPAFGGQLVAAITTRSAVQMATVRPGVLPSRTPPRRLVAPRSTCLAGGPRGRAEVLRQTLDERLEGLTTAATLIGVGLGVVKEDYGELALLREVLDAELVATRKVTDRGWLPRARQIGITGLALRPRLYVALGLSGRFNHIVGVRGAGTILGVNTDPEALLFEECDVGIVGDWRVVVPLLVSRLAEVLETGRTPCVAPEGRS
ncbi:MAG: FAD-binding protein [Acidimicrobiales bacterium]